ncbi:MAG: lysylphosphatidylglycerol synthase transmembrane domain-containing protein [Gammaproteobacteria bacterium]|nr:lysylphosphatidylglycerol synthase transmembrane domain-containing protein [Gammaproteobacteria bacterium]
MMLLNKKNSLTLVKFIFAGMILSLLVRSSQINFDLFVNILHNPFFLVKLTGILVVIVLFGTWRWSLLNNAQNITLGFKASIIPSYIGAAFNTLLPGAVGGDAIRCYYVFKLFPDRKSTILLTIFFDRILGLMGIITTLCVIALTHIAFLSQQKELFYLLSMTVFLCVGMFATFMAVMIFPQRFGLHFWLQKKFPDNKLVQFVVKYLDTFVNYRIPRIVLLKCLASSVMIQVLIATTLMLIAQMMDVPSIPFSHYAIAVGITLLVNLIPVTPGGIGVGEMAFAKILLLLNPSTTFAYATIYLCYRMLTILIYLPAVIFYLPGFKLLRTKSHDAAGIT